MHGPSPEIESCHGYVVTLLTPVYLELVGCRKSLIFRRLCKTMRSESYLARAGNSISIATITMNWFGTLRDNTRQDVCVMLCEHSYPCVGDILSSRRIHVGEARYCLVLCPGISLRSPRGANRTLFMTNIPRSCCPWICYLSLAGNVRDGPS